MGNFYLFWAVNRVVLSELAQDVQRFCGGQTGGLQSHFRKILLDIFKLDLSMYQTNMDGPKFKIEIFFRWLISVASSKGPECQKVELPCVPAQGSDYPNSSGQGHTAHKTPIVIRKDPLMPLFRAKNRVWEEGGSLASCLLPGDLVVARVHF